MTLRMLRAVDRVRYEHRGRKTWYWLKYPAQVRPLVAVLRRLVIGASRRLRKDA